MTVEELLAFASSLPTGSLAWDGRPHTCFDGTFNAGLSGKSEVDRMAYVEEYPVGEALVIFATALLARYGLDIDDLADPSRPDPEPETVRDRGPVPEARYCPLYPHGCTRGCRGFECRASED